MFLHSIQFDVENAICYIYNKCVFNNTLFTLDHNKTQTKEILLEDTNNV